MLVAASALGVGLEPGEAHILRQSAPTCTLGEEPALSMGDNGGDRPGRFANANHKTGTVLSLCLAKVVRQAVSVNVHVNEHVSHGFSVDAWAVNMVRNVFVLVHSGYEYHKNPATDEPWLDVPFSEQTKGHSAKAGRWQGALSAYHSYSDGGCAPTAVLNERMSYREALNALELADGLLLESLRALHRDVPYMLAAAAACSRVAAISTSRPPVCANVALDILDEDLQAGFENTLSPTLRLDDWRNASLSTRFASACGDPGAHGTDTSGRTEAVKTIRALDAARLGGRLQRAEAQLDELLGEPVAARALDAYLRARRPRGQPIRNGIQREQA